MTSGDVDISRARFRLWLLALLTLAACLRGVFPTADPPWNPSVGIVWHDEGAWVHNARNKALFGAWTTDAWNPMYIAPVFTGLEYGSFRLFGVGVRQARLVPEVLGLMSVLLLALGVARIGGRRSGLIAAALLATNYVYVMWNRAALMEAPMAAFMVAAWYCYTRAQENARWGWLAGICALLAFFTKASAAFFVVALAFDAVATVLVSARGGIHASADGRGENTRAALTTLGGLALAGVVAAAVFVLPHWSAYRFYNVEMSITRKPSYTIKALIDRVTWLPVLHDLFTRMWFVLTLALASALGTLARWRKVRAGERLLLLWVFLGALELVLHDVGNERRLVFFIPALVALASLALGRDRTVTSPEAAAASRTRALIALPAILYCSYIVAAAIVRIGFLYEVRPNVRLAAAIAILFTAALYATWPRIPRLLSSQRWSPPAALGLTALVAAGQLAQFGQWAAGRTYKNFAASVELGRRLAPGTPVHGKLANGLALENGIRPVFIGRGFGNYADRLSRDDVRYILTYIAPSLGYESQARNPVILEVLHAYPNHRTIMTFDVAETATGHDRAALIDKFGSGEQPGLPRNSGSAHD